VRITDVRVTLHDRTSPTLDVFDVPDGRRPMGVLSISLPGPGRGLIARQTLWDLIASATLGEVA
jgi:hypothetical protein